MTTGKHRARVAIATNNGDIGGGEVMLLNIARALREIGIEVLVIGPTGPGDLVVEAAARGFETIALPAEGRRAYMLALLRWRLRNRRIPLWCNGLVPSTATAGIGPRIVHLHILPTWLQRLAAEVARCGARTVLVPSRFMADRVRGARVLENWTEELPLRAPRGPSPDGAPRIGYMGRLTTDKGVDVLGHAVQLLRQRSSSEVRLMLAGENRFGDASDDAAISAALAPLGDAVDRLGWVDRADFFDSVDLVVFPAVWPESFGLVAAEAMAAGVPFVISDVGALREVAGPDHPWVSRAGEAEDLAAVLEEALFGLGGPAADTLVAAARERWEQKYSPAAGTGRVRALLEDLAEGPAGPSGSAVRALAGERGSGASRDEQDEERR